MNQNDRKSSFVLLRITLSNLPHYAGGDIVRAGLTCCIRCFLSRTAGGCWAGQVTVRTLSTVPGRAWGCVRVLKSGGWIDGRLRGFDGTGLTDLLEACYRVGYLHTIDGRATIPMETPLGVGGEGPTALSKPVMPAAELHKLWQDEFYGQPPPPPPPASSLVPAPSPGAAHSPTGSGGHISLPLPGKRRLRGGFDFCLVLDKYLCMEIFTWVGPRALARAEACSPTWRRLAGADPVWRRLFRDRDRKRASVALQVAGEAEDSSSSVRAPVAQPHDDFPCVQGLDSDSDEVEYGNTGAPLVCDPQLQASSWKTQYLQTFDTCTVRLQTFDTCTVRLG